MLFYELEVYIPMLRLQEFSYKLQLNKYFTNI